MSVSVLDRLASDEFVLSVGFLSTPSSLRRLLQRAKEVAEIRESLKQEAITDDTLRRFVSRLLEDFRRGERFVHELALAALAVAVERRPTDFADEYLHDLARLQIAELSMAIRVARESLKHRIRVAETSSKLFRMPDGEPSGSSHSARRSRSNCRHALSDRLAETSDEFVLEAR